MVITTIENPWSIDEHQFPYGGSPQCRYEFLVRYACLAPSSHNSQPWLFEATHDGLDVYADPTRALPVVDPENRELIISCGAALEYLCVSARKFGFVPETDLRNPEHDRDFLARFSFGGRAEPDELDLALFDAIPMRHTNRMKFDERAVPGDVIEQLKSVCNEMNVWLITYEREADRQDIARLVGEADRIQAADPLFRRELAAWIHANRSRSRDGMPGFAHGVGDLQSVVGSFVVRTFDWGKGQAANDKQLVLGSPLLAVLSTNGDSRTEWLNVGRALSRVLLTLTHHGLSASFLNQPIEVADLRPAFKEKIGRNRFPQILLRIGYGPECRPTPRRPVEQVLLNH